MRLVPLVRKTFEVLCNSLALLPLLSAWCLSIWYAVNTKFLDQWGHAPAVLGFFDGNLGISDLFTQHTESRMFFPRLITIALAWATNWDTRVEILCIHLILFSIAFCLWALLRNSFLRSPLLRVSLLVYGLVLLYSLQQWWNFLFGFQIALYLPNLCLLVSLLALHSRWTLTAKLCLFAVCSLVATYSYANGMMLWPLLFFGLLAYEGENLRSRSFDLLVFVLLGVVSVGLYFLGYTRPSGHADLLPFFENSRHLIALYATWLGALFSQSYDPAGTAQCFGSFFLAIFGFCLLYVLCRWRGMEFRRTALPWIILGIYSLGSGVPVALSRSAAGAEGMLASRYLAFSVYLAIATLPLLFLVLRDAARYLGALLSTAMQLMALVLACFIIVFSVASSYGALPAAHAAYLDRRNGQAALRLLPLVVEDSIRTIVNGQIELKAQALALERYQLLERPLLRLKDIAFKEGHPTAAYGAILRRSKQGASRQTLQGWSYLPRQNRVADVVLFTYELRDGRRVPAAYAFTSVPLPIRAVHSEAEAKHYRWQAHLHVPQGAQIKVWALNSDSAEAYLLGDSSEEAHSLEDIEFVRDAAISAGSLDRLHYQDNGWIKAIGWAYLTKQKRAADSVLFTVQRDGEDVQVVEFFPGAQREDVAHALASNDARYAGWQARFRAPFPGARVEAWAFDARQGRAYLLGGASQGFVIPKGPMLYDPHRLVIGPLERGSKKRIVQEGYSPRDVRSYY